MPDVNGLPGDSKTAATLLRELLKSGEIKLKKIGEAAVANPYTDTILTPGMSAQYYGIIDTINVDDRHGSVGFGGNKKASGVVSVILNGTVLIDQNDLTVRKPVEDIRLDTGLNILVLYADNYGKTPAATGSMNVIFPNKKFVLDFASPRDLGSTFIVAKIYYAPEKEARKQTNTAIANSIFREMSDADVQQDLKNYHYPSPDKKNLLINDSAKAKAGKALFREAKPVGNIKATSRKIILALWDDAVEDGDSISLNINGQWVVQGFPVKKKPQFIAVTLDGGQNKILFIADNLGAIVPNTAILEIIDGNQRRSFMIDTDLGRNNLIDIRYDLKPE